MCACVNTRLQHLSHTCFTAQFISQLLHVPQDCQAQTHSQERRHSITCTTHSLANYIQCRSHDTLLLWIWLPPEKLMRP